MTDSLETKLVRVSVKHQLFAAGDRILVAVSGGPDSVALLHLLNGLRQQLSLHLEVAHLQHGIRGAEAEADAGFVKGLCRELDIPLHLKEIDLPRIKLAAGKGNLEALARIERYRFFARVMERQRLDKVATAHTLDDQAETMLLWFFRGAGMKGLGGMAARLVTADFDAAKICVIRPLLETSKAEILAYLEAKGIEYRVDRTNFDTAYLRNWLRRELLPLIRSRVDERLPQRLSQQAELLREEDAFLDEAARAKLITMRGDDQALRRDLLLREPPVMQRRILRLWLADFRGKLSGIDFEHLAAILRLAGGALAQGRLAMPGGHELVCEYGKLRLRKNRRGRAGSCYNYELSVGKTLHIQEAQVQISSERLAPGVLRLPASLTEAVFDDAFLTAPLLVRNFRNGDRYQPLGMTGHKKVKDLFIDEKIPLGTRAVLPLLTMAGQVLWIPGYGRSEQGKVTNRTAAVVHFKTAPSIV